MIKAMNVYINNQPVEVGEHCSLAQLLSERGLDAPGTAVAVDGKIVSRDLRATHILQSECKIIVVKGVCGG